MAWSNFDTQLSPVPNLVHPLLKGFGVHARVLEGGVPSQDLVQQYLSFASPVQRVARWPEDGIRGTPLS